MARFINSEKDIIERNIDNASLTTSIEYSKFMEGTPTFVTYYHKDIQKSTQDKGLEDTKDIIGSESPVKFNKIEDFPLYGIQDINPRTEINEFGKNIEVESDAIILANTLRPLAGDYFTIYYNGEHLLFRVLETQMDKLNGKKHYRITYDLSRDDINLLEEQITDEYVSHFENIGTEKNNVIPKKISIIIEKIIQVRSKLIEFYIREFSDDKFGFITYHYSGKDLYNEYLIRFLLNTQCLKENTFLNSNYVQDIMKDTTSLYYIYEKTIYGAVENKNIENLELENFRTIPIIEDRNSPFYFSPKTYYRCQYMIDKNLHKPHHNKLISKINSGIKFENSNEYYLENIIIDFLNNKLEIDMNFLQEIENMYFVPQLKTFLLLPCLIFIIEDEKNELENRILKGEYMKC